MINQGRRFRGDQVGRDFLPHPLAVPDAETAVGIEEPGPLLEIRISVGREDPVAPGVGRGAIHTPTRHRHRHPHHDLTEVDESPQIFDDPAQVPQVVSEIEAGYESGYPPPGQEAEQDRRSGVSSYGQGDCE